MRCKKIKELLFSAYHDKELSPERNREVEEHLAGCPECRALSEKIRKLAIDPFRKAKSPEISKDIWRKIRATIELEKSPRLRKRVLSNIRQSLFNRKPVFALATAAVLLVVLVVANPHRRRMNGELFHFMEEQFLFFDSLAEGSGYFHEDLGIPGEEFFL